MGPPGKLLTSLDSIGSDGSSVCLQPGLSSQPHLSHEQVNPHVHNSYNYNRIVRETGRQVIQKMWRGEQDQDVIEYSTTHGFGNIR